MSNIIKFKTRKGVSEFLKTKGIDAFNWTGGNGNLLTNLK